MLLPIKTIIYSIKLLYIYNIYYYYYIINNNQFRIILLILEFIIILVKYTFLLLHINIKIKPDQI